jgi:hypothetical protein
LKRAQLILAIACFFLLAPQVCLAQEPEDWDWVNEHFGPVLDEFLPIGESGSVGYRSYRDLYTNVLEYSFVLSENWNEKRISATVRAADGISLYDQMMALHRKNPGESVESMKTKLKVKEWRLDSTSCPALRASYEGFEGLSLPVLSARERAERAKGVATVTLHPVVHTFKAVISGGTMRLVLTEQDHPFVLWAIKTRRSLEKCAAKNIRP